MCGLAAPREATTGADINVSPTADPVRHRRRGRVGHGHHTGARTGEEMWEVVIPLVASLFTLVTAVYAYLALLAADEKQPVLQVLLLRFKTVRMRVLVKRRMRRK